MAKLTRKQFDSITYALRNAERARAYLFSDTVAVCRKGTTATTTLHYSRSDGQSMYEVDKDIGSDLTGLDAAIGQLKSMIDEHISAKFA